MGGDMHLAYGLADHSRASCSVRSHQNADWTQLPEGPRLLIVQLMDPITRAAWRTTCKSTCQDVHAVTHTLTWRNPQDEQLIDVPQPHKEPFGETTHLPAALIASLPNLLHLNYFNCGSVSGLTSIQGIPPTLRSLDLGINVSLTSLAPLQHCTALQQLVLPVSSKSLARTMPPVTSALSGHLLNLTLWFDREDDPSIAKAVVRSLKPLTRLQELKLNCCGGDDAYWELLAPVLGLMTDLRVLYLSQHEGSGALSPLASAIRQLKQLQSLNLSWIYMHSDATAAVAAAIAALPPTLTRLKLGTTHITLDSVPALTLALEAQSATLRSLDLSGPNLSPAALILLGPCLRHCSTLTDLDLSCVNEDDPTAGTLALVTALSGNVPHLTSLNLSGNHLTDDGAAALAPALASISTLARLDYRYNRLGPMGAAVLAPALLSIARSLTRLDFCSNPLGFNGLRALTQGLQALSGQQRWCIYCPKGLVTQDSSGAWALSDPDDAQELASIVSSVTCHHSWVLQVSLDPGYNQLSAACKVSGLVVTFSR